MSAVSSSDAAERLELPLLSLFREMLTRGARLSIRDYLDLLRALEGGFGTSPAQGRESLRRTAEILWARSDEERRIVTRWFEAIGPVPEKMAQAMEMHVRHAMATTSGLTRANDASVTRTDALPGESSVSMASDPVGGPSTAASASDTLADSTSASMRVAFETAPGGGSLPLPRAFAVPTIADDYVLHPKPLISMREMVVLWRRDRRAARSGPRTELDVAATVHERCRDGLLSQPVFRARRRNTARLLVLVDSSPSMAPWMEPCRLMDSSLAQSRLGDVALRWFSNVPRQQLHTASALNAPEARDELLRRFQGAGLLIVSDAGSARGLLNRRRAAQTREFLNVAAAACPRIVWLNPMPLARWIGSTAAQLAMDPRMTMLPLDAEHMLRAVDILRGHK